MKFLFKVALLVVAGYFLIRVPFFKDMYDSMKASLIEKTGNVTAEYERVKGKLDQTKYQIDEYGNKIEAVKEKVDNTLEGIENVVDTVDGIVNGDGEEGEVAPANEEEVTEPTEETPTEETVTEEPVEEETT